jgi:alpha-1,2-mannosyltransferase
VWLVLKSGKWLTRRRVRLHGAWLAAGLWSVYAWIISAPGVLDRNGLIKGTDFLHFYTLGELAREGRGDLLYDSRAQEAFSRRLIPEAANYFYVPLYGPQVSLWFAPFSRLSYLWALAAWLSLNVVLYAFCCFAIWKNCPKLQDEPGTIAILAAAFPGFFHLLLWGQSSGLALVCFTLAYLALRHNHRVLAGFAIGSLIFKPQLALAAAVVFVFLRAWRIIAGAGIAALAQLGMGWLYYGRASMLLYLHALAHVREVFPFLEPRPYQTHSLRSFWSLLVAVPQLSLGLYAASAILTLIITLQCWQSGASLEIRYSALLLASVLIAPHLTVYDLVILAPGFLFLGDWVMAQPPENDSTLVRFLLYLCYPLFLAGPVARVTHLQLSVITMAILLWRLWQRTLEIQHDRPSAPWVSNRCVC